MGDQSVASALFDVLFVLQVSPELRLEHVSESIEEFTGYRAQEYLDDEGGTGVLRLTTLVFALPDGSPLQKVGVFPQIALGLSPAGDRESGLSHAPATWRGPDVRAPRLAPSAPWPSHSCPSSSWLASPARPGCCRA